MHRHVRSHLLLCCLVLAGASVRADVVVGDFEDLALAPNSAFQGPMPNAVQVTGRWGPEMQGTFNTGGIDLMNRRNATFGSWSGFAYSNQVDNTTAGWLNQFSVFTAAAHSGTNFGIAFGYHDLEANLYEPEAFDPLNIEHLEGLPYLTLPVGAAIEGMFVTNTTYTALSLLLGDDFTGRPFGGNDGTIADWYKMTAYGADAAGNILTDASGNALAVDYYLADNRQGQMFIAQDWTYLNLSSLAGAERLYFNVSGTLSGLFGLNTPGYFAVDDIRYGIDPAAVPEPASLVMAASAVALLAAAAGRRATRIGSPQS